MKSLLLCLLRLELTRLDQLHQLWTSFVLPGSASRETETLSCRWPTQANPRPTLGHPVKLLLRPAGVSAREEALRLPGSGSNRKLVAVQRGRAWGSTTGVLLTATASEADKAWDEVLMHANVAASASQADADATAESCAPGPGGSLLPQEPQPRTPLLLGG